ncbi:uncharacterized protein UTRI_06210_B [Ustilago trichophora]|uniref:Effector family protein Eff1 n=1 Tax=Ustilago trichophora TaxID=86804 RepID=A0A5C3EJU6_9BASI|nr:uncharacterized protein UTRI_06210_B [Ustilago trichophora]
MRASLIALILLAANLASVVFPRPTPVFPQEPEGSSDSNIHLRMNGVSDSSQQQLPVTGEARASAFDLIVPLQTPPSLNPGTAGFDPIFTPLPIVRNDIVKSFLTLRLGIHSNEPLQLVLAPSERKALFEMGQKHLAHQGATWFHSVVDEPKFDLTYKRQLYVAAPIANYDWQKVVGMPKSEETAQWLPIVFYKADLDSTRENHFKLAGIEVVKDMDEIQRVLRSWDSPDTLEMIGRQFKMAVSHP